MVGGSDIGGPHSIWSHRKQIKNTTKNESLYVFFVYGIDDKRSCVFLRFTISPAILYLVTTKSSAMVFSLSSLSAISSAQLYSDHVITPYSSKKNSNRALQCSRALIFAESLNLLLNSKIFVIDKLLLQKRYSL